MPARSARVPPYDPELLPALLSYLPDPRPSQAQLVADSRRDLPDAAQLLAGRNLVHSEHVVELDRGRLVVSVFAQPRHMGLGPGILFLHGGGMIGGNRFSDVRVALDWVEQFDAVVATVEYRLAPEHPDPAPRDDALSALTWFHENSVELGVDRDRIVLCGVSAGGGLTAGLALKWRDSGGSPLLGQILICPMLDDRNTIVGPEIDELALWDHGSNEIGWSSLLGPDRGGPSVSPYAAPARAEDLSGLPSTFIDVGSVDIFRDENIAYAARMWSTGGSAELHVWSGGFHAFDLLAPDAALSREATTVRTNWLGRLLGASPSASSNH